MPVSQMQGLDTLYKPWGMTAGGMVGSRQTDMEAANLLSLEQGMLSNVLKQVEASRAANDFNNPQMEQWRQAGLIGQGMQQDAAGRLKQGTLGTDITAGNQKNRAETMENQAKAFMMESDMVMSIPDGLAGVGAQLSPQMQQLAQQVGGIDRLKQVLPRFNEMLKQRLSQTPKFLGEKEMENIKFGQRVSADSAQQTQKHTNDMERVRFEAAARQKEHDANLKAIEQSRRSDAEKIQSLEQLATSYLKAAEEATDPADRDSYMKSYEKAYNALMGSKTAASSAKSLGDVNAVRALRGLPPLTQEQYDQQQKQEGSTGTTGGWGATEIKATR